jgi:hypothetical protein
MEVMQSVLFETNRQKSRTKVPQWNQKQANSRVINSANLLCDTGVKIILVARCWVVQKGWNRQWLHSNNKTQPELSYVDGVTYLMSYQLFNSVSRNLYLQNMSRRVNLVCVEHQL